MNSTTIQKYSKRKTKNLKKAAQTWFNKYIRLRDTDDNGFGNCISSGRILKYGTDEAQAGHYFSAGHYQSLRFNEHNVNLQSKADNYYKHGNLLEYRKNLIKKIGLESVEALEEFAERSKKETYKEDRFLYIEIIELYKEKCKKLERQKMF